MLDRTLPPRHWSPCQAYATGDVVIDLLSQGWQITSIQPSGRQSRARLHTLNLVRDGEKLDLLVLDGPVIHSILSDRLPTPPNPLLATSG